MKTARRRIRLGAGIALSSFSLLGATGILSTGLITTGPPSASAQPTTIAVQTTATTTSSDTPTIEIVDLGTSVLTADADLELTVQLTNPGTEPLTVTRLDIRSQTSVLTTVPQVANWMTGGGYYTVISKNPSTLEILPGATLTHQLTVPRETITWPTGEYSWGPRGIEVAAQTDAEKSLTDRSVVIVLPEAELTPMPVSVVVPVTYDASVIAEFPDWIDVLADGNDETTTLDSSLTSTTLASWNMAGVSLFIDPSVLSDPQLSTAVHNSIEPVHLLPLYDADLAALAHTGYQAKAEPLVAAGQLLADSSAIDASFDIALPAGIPDQDSLALARDLGVRAAIITDAAVPLIHDPYFVPHALSATLVYDDPLPVLVSASSLNTALSGILPGTETSPGAEMLLSDLDRQQVLLALSAVQYRELPNASRASVVVVDREALYDPDLAAQQTAVKELVAAPWLAPSSVDKLLATNPDTHARQSLGITVNNPGELDTAAISALDDALVQVDEFTAVFDESAQISATAHKHAEVLFAVHWREFPDERTAQITALAPSPEAPVAIQVESSSTINMISTSSALPIRVTNPFDYPANVVISLAASDSRLQAPQPVSARLAENSTTTVSVPVEAWGSGNLTVTITVMNSNGVVVGRSADVEVRVRADWENWGTLIVAGLIGVLLIFGVRNSVRKGRRSAPIKVDDYAAAVNAPENSRTNAGEDSPPEATPKKPSPSKVVRRYCHLFQETM